MFEIIIIVVAVVVVVYKWWTDQATQHHYSLPLWINTHLHLHFISSKVSKKLYLNSLIV